MEQMNLDNTKIDVQEYATRYGVTLEQANNEIQPWLFEQGYSWTCQPHEVQYTYAAFIYVYKDKHMSYDAGAYHFDNHTNKQIFLERNIVLTVRSTPDIIEIDGRKYVKEDVMKAIGFADVQQIN